MSHFDTSLHIKGEHQFELFQYPKMENSSNSNPSSPSLSSCHNGSMKPDYICLGSGCFVCERAAIQALPENANWKKKVQNSIIAYQMQHTFEQTLYGGSFNLDSLRRLKPAESEKTKPFYIYDEKLGRKRRHDPWFAKHKVNELSSAKRPDQRRKRMKFERDENKQFQCTPFILDTCMKMESSPSEDKNFLSTSTVVSPTLCGESTTTQPLMIQPEEEQDSCNLVSNNNNHNNTGDLCITNENLVQLLNLNQLDFIPNVNINSCENNDDNAKLELDATAPETGIAHGLDLEWMMGVLAE